jgi:hypothetical protein
VQGADLPGGRILNRRVDIGKVTTKAGMVDMEWCLTFQKVGGVNVDASEVEVGRETRRESEGGDVRGRGPHEVRDTEITTQIGVRRVRSRAGAVRLGV